MSRRNLGIMFAMVGSALGAWWVMTQRRPRVSEDRSADRGRVIYDNTPQAADVDPIL